ncbi:MAG: response regulator [Beijerinckiaceae bacterium]|nr:response regulator [Beijerinckiaceae bacterium]
MSSGRGILLIDEDPYVRVVLSAELEASGRTVWASGNPDAALEWARENEFEIALVDGCADAFSPSRVARVLRLQHPEIAIAFLGGPAQTSAEFPVIEEPETMADFVARLTALAAAPAPGRRLASSATRQQIADGLAPDSPLAQSAAGRRTRSVFERLRTRLSA